MGQLLKTLAAQSSTSDLARIADSSDVKTRRETIDRANDTSASDGMGADKDNRAFDRLASFAEGDLKFETSGDAADHVLIAQVSNTDSDCEILEPTVR